MVGKMMNKKVPKELTKQSNRIRSKVCEEVRKEGFLEETEQFQREIGFISPYDLQRYFNI